MYRSRKKSGETTVSEIVILFFVVIGAVAGMSVYFQRALQARMRDANRLVIKTVSEARGNAIPAQYEPYYAVANSLVSRDEDITDQLFGGGATGINLRTVNSVTGIIANSYQAPPREAD